VFMGVVALDADALVLLPPEGAAAAAVEVEGKGRSLACGRKLLKRNERSRAAAARGLYQLGEKRIQICVAQAPTPGGIARRARAAAAHVWVRVRVRACVRVRVRASVCAFLVERPRASKRATDR